MIPLCTDCDRRHDCFTLCQYAERRASKGYKAQREAPIDPTLLDYYGAPPLSAVIASENPRKPALLLELERRLDQLSHRQRLVIELHFRDGLNVREIAHRLGVAVPTARERLTRALEILRGISAHSKS